MVYTRKSTGSYQMNFSDTFHAAISIICRRLVNNTIKINPIEELCTMSIYRGEIYYADLSPVVGSEQGGVRPVLIVQNDVGNRHSPTVIAAAITSQREKNRLPTHIEIDSSSCGLAKDSVVLLEQIRTIDKQRLKERMGVLDQTSMDRINNALQVSFGLN